MSVRDYGSFDALVVGSWFSPAHWSLVAPGTLGYGWAMSFWTAIVAIVALGIFSDVLQKVIKQKKAGRADADMLLAKDAQIAELEEQVNRLNEENAMLKVDLEEQRILADEAVSTFGSRLERLKKDQRTAADGEQDVLTES